MSAADALTYIAEGVDKVTARNLSVGNPAFNFPNAVGTAGQVLTVNGGGNLIFGNVTSAGMIIAGDNITVTQDGDDSTVALDDNIAVGTVTTVGLEINGVPFPNPSGATLNHVLTITAGNTMGWTAEGSGAGVSSIACTDSNITYSAATGAVTSALATNLSIAGHLDTFNAQPSVQAIGAALPAIVGTTEHIVALGVSALNSLTTGQENVAIASLALSSLTTGGGNIIIGDSGAAGLTVGNNNVGMGSKVMQNAASGVSNNVAIGNYAGQNMTGNNNVIISPKTTGGDAVGTLDGGNVIIGVDAGNLVTGSNYTLIGQNAGSVYTATNDGTAIGYNALASCNAANCVAVGHNCGNNSIAKDCTFIGSFAGSGFNNAGATDNTIIGYGIVTTAGGASGADNTIVGSQSAPIMTTGHQNVIFGSASADLLTTGSDNVFLGYNCGSSITTGSNNILIGPDIDPGSNASNSIIIGSNASQTLAIGSFISGASGTNTTIGNLDATIFAVNGKSLQDPTTGSSGNFLTLSGTNTMEWVDVTPGGVSSVVGTGAVHVTNVGSVYTADCSLGAGVNIAPTLADGLSNFVAASNGTGTMTNTFVYNSAIFPTAVKFKTSSLSSTFEIPAMTIERIGSSVSAMLSFQGVTFNETSGSGSTYFISTPDVGQTIPDYYQPVFTGSSTVVTLGVFPCTICDTSPSSAIYGSFDLYFVIEKALPSEIKAFFMKYAAPSNTPASNVYTLPNSMTRFYTVGVGNSNDPASGANIRLSWTVNS